MPIRAFVTATFTDLTATTPPGIIMLLEQALRTGNLHTLRNNHTGFLTQTDILKPADVQRLYNQARYEAYLRVQALDNTGGNPALKAQWTNPWIEKTMSVETRRLHPWDSAFFQAIT